MLDLLPNIRRLEDKIQVRENRIYSIQVKVNDDLVSNTYNAWKHPCYAMFDLFYDLHTNASNSNVKYQKKL